MIKKIQAGYKKEDIVNAACRSISENYINGVLKGKKIKAPVVFIGGVSKNKVIAEEIEKLIGEKVIVDKNAHLLGAYGVALLARSSKLERDFNFDISKYNMETRLVQCNHCSNNCEIVTVYRNNEMIDYWGNKCKKGNKFSYN